MLANLSFTYCFEYFSYLYFNISFVDYLSPLLGVIVCDIDTAISYVLKDSCPFIFSPLLALRLAGLAFLLYSSTERDEWTHSYKLS